MFDSCSFTHQFKLNFEETKHVAIGHFVSSGDISAGGHLSATPVGKEKRTRASTYLSSFNMRATSG